MFPYPSLSQRKLGSPSVTAARGNWQEPPVNGPCGERGEISGAGLEAQRGQSGNLLFVRKVLLTPQ